MTSKQRVWDTLNHRQPDQVPVDFGGTMCSGMHVTCVDALRRHYGLLHRPVKVYEPFQMLGLIEEDLKQALGVDVEAVNPPKTLFGFENSAWKEWRLDNGLDVLVPGNFNTTKDDRGNTYIYPEGDTSVPPSGRMPYQGYYFDALVRQEPLVEEALDPKDNLEEFLPISNEDLAYFEKRVRAASQTDRCVLASFGGTGLGDIALVPSSIAAELRRPSCHCLSRRVSTS